MALRRPRLIPRLAIKGDSVIVTVNMEGLRKVGKPSDLARKYAEDADELLYLDAVASLYGRNQLESVLESTVEGVLSHSAVATYTAPFVTSSVTLIHP